MIKKTNLIFILLSIMLLSFTIVEASPLMQDGPQPGEPGWISFFWDDQVSENAGNKTALTFGDEFYKNLYERPFSAEDMVYQAELDIIKVEVTNDDNYYYFTIRMNGSNAELGGLTGWYGIEIDVDMDGTGDYLIWSDGDSNSDWNHEGLRLLKDKNNDVGGRLPLMTEANRRPEDSFEKVIFASGNEENVGMVWKRRDPDDVYAMEFALNKAAIENDGMFLWSAWANDDPEAYAKMDYNDLYTLEKAGSPVSGESVFPLKALAGVDNTCRLPYGFTPSGSEPGACYGVKPTAVPVPVKVPSGNNSAPAPTAAPCNCPGCVILNGVCTVVN